MDMIFILLAALSGSLFTVGDILLKYWADRSSVWFIASAMFLYLLAGITLAFAFKRREVAVAIAVLLCFNLLTVALAGLLLFKEVLGLKEIIGISLALIAIVVMTI
ncbi:hypothetical protein H6503_00205 [Candidatus Woesearchaeota archaeon]|nr:hypothetical protein [Candidatus Woesearchaeota archaeon]